MKPVTALAEHLDHRQVSVYLTSVALGVAIGAVAPGAGEAFEAAIYPVLGALLYVTFLQVPFDRIKEAFRDRTFLVAALGLNFVVVPPIAFALSRLAPGGTAVEVGVLMVLLTPCIDYVIVFARLAGGSEQRLLVAAPLLMLAQMALLPVFLFLLVGPELGNIIAPGPFIEAFLVLIALPLALAWLTELWATRTDTGRRFKTAADLSPVALMALTLSVVVASQWPRVEHSLGDVIGVIPLYVAFLIVMAAIGTILATRLGFDSGAGRALVFSGATRNSLVVLPLALALGDEYALAAAVIVTQTIVEVIGMVVYVRAIPRLLPERPSVL
ncbi:MAG: arsenic resistance protein [Actinomycetota bacterium]|nr:arsenic resistance protein [Actinomycetota bacterium]